MAFILKQRNIISAFKSRNIHSCSCLLKQGSKDISLIADVNTLHKRITESIIEAKEKPSDDYIFKIFEKLKNLQAQVYDYDKFWKDPNNLKISEEIQRVLASSKVDLNEDLLRKLLLLRFPSNVNIDMIKEFYIKHPSSFINKEVALIPFRYCLFDGDLRNALTITDLTTGHPNYLNNRQKELRNGFYKLVSTAVGVTLFSKWGVNELIEWGYLEGVWKHLSSINSMILTYVINSAFFVSLVRLGRIAVAAGGDFLRWQKGTFFSHWYRHADELQMCSRIVETDVELNGGGPSGGEPSSELVDELCRLPDDVDPGTAIKTGFNRDGKKVRLIELRDNLEDIKMQAYWLSGGDGFEWVEPDQDPAIIIWKDHLKSFENQNLNGSSVKSLKWADGLIDG